METKCDYLYGFINKMVIIISKNLTKNGEPKRWEHKRRRRRTIHNFTSCPTEVEVADQICCLTQSHNNTGPTSPCTVPITLDTWQGDHPSSSHWYDLTSERGKWSLCLTPSHQGSMSQLHVTALYKHGEIFLHKHDGSWSHSLKTYT